MVTSFVYEDSKFMTSYMNSQIAPCPRRHIMDSKSTPHVLASSYQDNVTLKQRSKDKAGQKWKKYQPLS